MTTIPLSNRLKLTVSIHQRWLIPSMIPLFWILFLLMAKGPMNSILVDDSFIYMQVADNIVEGNGWTYNSTPDANPITSPLYLLIIVFLRLLGMGGEMSMHACYIGFLMLTGLFLYEGMRVYVGRFPALAMALMISCGGVISYSWGMESSLFTALITGTALAWQRERYLLSGFLTGLMVLARPEGALLLGVIGLLYLVNFRKIPWKIGLNFAAPVIPWLVFAWVQFGGLVPHSVKIKSLQATIRWHPSHPSWLMSFFQQSWIPLVTVMLFGLGMYLAWRKWGKDLLGKKSFITVICGFGIVQILGFTVMNAPIGYHWYYIPGNLALNLGVVIALYFIAKWVLQKCWPGGDSALKNILIAGFLMLAMLRLGASRFHLLFPYRHGQEYARVAEWIEKETDKNARVTATEIGYLGYYSDRDILDVHGLLHTHSLQYLKDKKWDWWYVHSYPEVIVTHDPAWPGEPRLAEWRASNYQHFQTHFREAFATSGMKVFVKDENNEGL